MGVDQSVHRKRQVSDVEQKVLIKQSRHICKWTLCSYNLKILRVWIQYELSNFLDEYQLLILKEKLSKVQTDLFQISICVENLLKENVLVLIKKVNAFLIDNHYLSSFKKLCSFQRNFVELNFTSLVCFLTSNSRFFVYSSELQNFWIWKKGQDISSHP